MVQAKPHVKQITKKHDVSEYFSLKDRDNRLIDLLFKKRQVFFCGINAAFFISKFTYSRAVLTKKIMPKILFFRLF